MSGERVTLCLPPSAGSDVPAAVAAAIAPYDRNSDIEPYQGEWDHWHLGGQARSSPSSLDTNTIHA